jgi:hypothetical protein
VPPNHMVHMGERLAHAGHVDTWMERLPTHLTSEQLVSAFEQAFTALWRRAQQTLGAVTLSAIVDRVLLDVSARFPLLATLKLEDGVGVQFGELHQRARAEDAEQLRKGMRLVLIQFLTVIGNLTGEILTPALHVELSNARVEDLTARPAEHAASKPRESEGMER